MVHNKEFIFVEIFKQSQDWIGLGYFGKLLKMLMVILYNNKNIVEKFVDSLIKTCY